MLVVPVAIWFFMLQFVQNKDWKNRFVRIFIPWMTLLGFALCMAIPATQSNYSWVIIWVFLSGVLSESLRWGLFEMAERYLSPSQIGVSASYQGIFYEFGIISASLILKFHPALSLNDISVASWVCVLCILGLMALFLNPRRLELYFIQRKKNPLFSFDHEYSKIIWVLALLGVTQGLFRMTQDSYVQTIFKINSQSALDIQKNISSVFLLGSVLQLSLLLFNAKVLEIKRISPTYIIIASFFLQIVAFGYAFTHRSVESAIIFLSLSKPHTGIFFVSLNRLMVFFKYTANIAMKTFNRMGNVIIGGLIFAAIPSSLKTQEILIPTFCVLSIVLLFRLKQTLIPVLEKNIKSTHPDECVRAAVGLSYIQPPQFVEKMSQILDEKPSHLLKKQIILALGYTKDQKSFDILQNEFRSDREEIQITVLEALKIAKSNKATRFILDLVLSHRKALTLRVRLNAAQMLAALYGAKSIPILMLGLKTEDPRQLANVLEALSQFKDPELVEIYKTYAHSGVPRVRANALIGLYGFPRERSWIKQEIHKILSSEKMDDLGFKISIFYTIGKNKITEFIPILKRLLEEHVKAHESFKSMDSLSLSYAQTLSWALLRLKVPLGAETLYKILREHIKSVEVKSPIHFILQLDASERLVLLVQWIALSKQQSEMRDVLIMHFEKSGYDLQEEIEYLKSMNLAVAG
jgi:HEAT repeat protein